MIRLSLLLRGMTSIDIPTLQVMSAAGLTSQTLDVCTDFVVVSVDHVLMKTC